MIPARIHQIWLTDRPMPESQKTWCKTWKEKHPTWEYKLWDDSGWDEVGGEEYWYNKLNLQGIHPGITSDVLRALLINKFGGFYADTDAECLQSFDHLRNYRFVCGFDKAPVIMGAVFGGTVGNAITTELTSRFRPTGELLMRIGCGLFSDTVKDLLCQNDLVLGSRSFSRYCNHHYALSWCK